MALMGAGKRAIQAGVDSREDFRHGHVSGRWFGSWGDVPKGRMESVPAYRDSHFYRPVYVIFSYATPIAWGWNEGDGFRWVHGRDLGHKYSVTTTNHQHIVAVAADNPGFFANSR